MKTQSAQTDSFAHDHKFTVNLMELWTQWENGNEMWGTLVPAFFFIWFWWCLTRWTNKWMSNEWKETPGGRGDGILGNISQQHHKQAKIQSHSNKNCCRCIFECVILALCCQTIHWRRWMIAILRKRQYTNIYGRPKKKRETQISCAHKQNAENEWEYRFRNDIFIHYSSTPINWFKIPSLCWAHHLANVCSTLLYGLNKNDDMLPFVISHIDHTTKKTEQMKSI